MFEGQAPSLQGQWVRRRRGEQRSPAEFGAAAKRHGRIWNPPLRPTCSLKALPQGRQGGVLPRRGIVQQAGPKALHRGKARVPSQNALRLNAQGLFFSSFLFQLPLLDFTPPFIIVRSNAKRKHSAVKKLPKCLTPPRRRFIIRKPGSPRHNPEVLRSW